MADAQALVDQLQRQVQANDFDGGTATLTQLKVRADVCLLIQCPTYSLSLSL